MTKSVTIIGGGWAGLAAAVELSKKNILVNIYESAKQPGGRARSIKKNNLTIDNGQHLMIGAYQQMLDLLKTVNILEKDVFYRTPQHIKILDLKTNKVAFNLKLPKLPAPLNLLIGIFFCPSLSFLEKLQTLYYFNKLLNGKINQDISVDQWLSNSKLPEYYTEYLLKPLCLAALTTHTNEASAKAFQNILQKTFNGPAENTDLLIPKTDLENIFPLAAIKYIESKGGKVFTKHRVSQININNNQVTSIIVNDKIIDTDQLIIATPAYATSKLLSSIPCCEPVCTKLDKLEYSSVTTIYLQYPKETSLSTPMMGMVNATCEWIFDRQYCNQPGLIAGMISATGPHLEIDTQTLAQTVEEELKQAFPHWPKTESSQIICEKRASFSCTPNIDAIRPGINTAINNLKLCGDYVYSEEKKHTGLPSTLEGAVQSGVKCAQSILKGNN
jgi:hydroxysqualene dehydroxylase